MADAICGKRPFLSLSDLRLALHGALKNASLAAKLTLLRTHPDLAGKLAKAGQLTQESTREAGLGNTVTAKMAEALVQVHHIAGLILADFVGE